MPGKVTTFRNGVVYVCGEKCDTCFFKPGALDLPPGRRSQIITANVENNSALTCHKTLYEPRPGEGHAICRGYWEAYKDKVPVLIYAQLVGNWREQ